MRTRAMEAPKPIAVGGHAEARKSGAVQRIGPALGFPGREMKTRPEDATWTPAMNLGTVVFGRAAF